MTMNRAAARLAAGLLALCAALPAAAQQVPKEGFLCCNMRTDGDWISDINYEESGKRLIPYGTPLRFLDYGRYRVYVEIGGKRQGLGNDYSRDLTKEQFAARYIVTTDPRKAAAKASAKIRKAIETARVTKGMTREQVAMAVGYPVSSENADLKSHIWRFWLGSFSPFTVVFGEDGRVKSVEADPQILLRVYLE